MMVSPFQLPPPRAAQMAAGELIERVHAYMRAHPESELHRQGKMFGVLVYSTAQPDISDSNYISAFSAQLDGSYYHEGFVPPVYAMSTPPIGRSKSESQRLQQLLFANYTLSNARGESKSLLDIFASEPAILSPEEWFERKAKGERTKVKEGTLPPSGAGECCAPKLLQYAYTHGLYPIAMAEFWIGAPSRTEVRAEGTYYPPCSGRCVPILRYMLQGLEVEPVPEARQAQRLCQQIDLLYEDEYLLVINKPSGLLSVPGKGTEPSAASYLNARPVHRLDQDTSGLLVLAKTSEVYTALQSYFQRRDILKRYEAILRPHTVFPPSGYPSEGQITLPLLPNPLDRPRQMVDYSHGKPSITRYVVRETRPDGTLFVDFYPLTGRTHQLRVHSAHPDGLDAPIVGDRLYGTVDGSESKADSRLMLHAAEISFPHPITKEEMHFCIPSHF